MAFWLASAREGQDSDWLQRFDPRFWTLNFPRPKMAALTTTAADGTWTVTADAMSETAHLVQASVTDTAGGIGTARQVLTVDVTVPVLTIDGGTSRSTSDTSPWTYGTTAERAGTMLSDRGGEPTVNNRGVKSVVESSLAGGKYEGDVAKAITECWR